MNLQQTELMELGYTTHVRTLAQKQQFGRYRYNQAGKLQLGKNVRFLILKIFCAIFFYTDGYFHILIVIIMSFAIRPIIYRKMMLLQAAGSLVPTSYL